MCEIAKMTCNLRGRVYRFSVHPLYDPHLLAFALDVIGDALHQILFISLKNLVFFK